MLFFSIEAMVISDGSSQKQHMAQGWTNVTVEDGILAKGVVLLIGSLVCITMQGMEFTLLQQYTQIHIM